MNETRLSVRVTPQEKKEWEKIAKEQNISFTDFVKEALRVRAGFSTYFYARLKELSNAMGVSESIIIQNLIISWLARKDAEKQNKSHEVDKLLEFVFTPNGPVTGERLYNILCRHFVTENPPNEQEKKITRSFKISKRLAAALDVAEIDPSDINFKTSRGLIISELERIMSDIEHDNCTPQEKEVELKVFGRNMKRLYYKQSSIFK